MTTAYALGIRDRTGEMMFLRRGAFVGNLMSTPDPFSAWTWTKDADLEHWWAGLPESAREQLADRKLYVVPLSLAVGTPTQTLTWQTVEPETPQEGPPARTLNTSRTLFGDPE